MYSSFITLELKALMNLALTLLEEENFYEMYYEERMLISLQKLKLSIA